MDKKAAIKAYAIVAILLVSVSGIALAPFLASAVYNEPSKDGNTGNNCFDRSGTSIQACKTATGYWEKVVSYDWSISKSVSPDKREIDQNTTADFQYTLTIARSESVNEKYGVRGYVLVKNTGQSATQNLTIIDTVQYKDGTTFKDLVSFNVDTSGKPVLGPCEEHKYYYDFTFTPKIGAVVYNNVAKVTITNNGNNMGVPSGLSACDDFGLPGSANTTYKDKTATIVDNLVVPTGYQLVGTDAPAKWTVTGPGVVKFNVTIKNVDAPKGSISFMNNTVKLTEDDTKVCHEDKATVELTGGKPYSPPNPDVTVDKEGPKCAMPGQIITWTIYVNNTGNINLDKVIIVDDLVGYSNQISLPVGGTFKFDVTYRVPLNYNQMYIVNTVKVTADLEKDLIVQDSNSVPICYPNFTVAKVADMDRTSPSHYANWTITVTNTGDVDLKDLAVYDSLIPGGVAYVDVLVGKSVSIKVNMTVPSDFMGDKVCNTVKAQWSYFIPAIEDGEDDQQMDEVTLYHEATSCIPVVRASIEITKVADKDWACANEMITWNVTVTNTGNYDLKNVEVMDSSFGFDQFISLGAGKSWSIEFTGSVPPGAEKVLNTAYVYVDVFSNGELKLEDSASDFVMIGNPSVTVVKVGPSQGLYPGDSFTYTIYVNNTGNVPLENVWVYDPLIGIDENISLGVGGKKVYTMPWSIPVDWASNEYKNTVCVSSFWKSCEVKDNSMWCIPVLHKAGEPCISIEKHGPCRAMAGETVPYIIVVKNTGNVPLTNLNVSDDIGGDGVGVVWFQYNGILQPGAYWNITTSATIPADFSGPYFINVVEVFGQYVYDGGSKNVWCIDSHAIDIINPNFTIVKSAPCISAQGHNITYTLWVNNTGDVDLINVVITDVMAPNGGFNIDYLPMGGSVKLCFNWTVPLSYAPEKVCNVASGSAFPGPSAYWCGCGEACPWFEKTNFGREVKVDSNQVCTFIVKPKIDVVKVGPAMAKIGQTIQYNITVTNTGNYCIENITVSDPMIKFYATGLTLGPMQSYTYKVMWYVSEDWVDDYIDGNYWVCNTVNATGDTFNDTHSMVYDQDDWCVFIGAPHISIIKKGPVEASPGELIWYNITVTNDGNLPLHNVNVTDALLGASWYHYIGSMSVGAVVQFNASYTIPNPFQGNLKNVANVTGDDVTDTTVNDTNSTTVFVANPGIDVSKWWDGDMTALGHYVNWSIDVKNTGNVNLTNVVVTDPLTGETFTVGTLNKGDSKSLVAHYFVTENSPWNKTTYKLCNEVFAEGQYNQRIVKDNASDCVFVALPSFEVTKCAPRDWVCYGNDIVWTIKVENTGNVDLMNVTINDPLTGDKWTDISIPVGKNVTKTVTYDTDGQAALRCPTVPNDNVCNTVYVIVDTFNDGHCILEGKAESCVFVVRPDVEVEKSGPKVAVGGEKIQYTIKVRNVGNVDLNVLVTDAMLEVNQMVLVNESECKELTFWYTVPLCSAGTVITNTVYVNGSWVNSPCCYDLDKDDHCVTVLTESIKIIKDGPRSAMVGQKITFTFDVWNDGQVDLSNVYVSDPLMNGAIWNYTEGDKVLSPGEHWKFSVEYTIPMDYLGGNSCGGLTNWACAHGSYNGVGTMWGAGWAVWVYDPACGGTPKPT